MFSEPPAAEPPNELESAPAAEPPVELESTPDTAPLLETLPFPERARVVIIGGGIMGCSVAYHLGQMGWRDVMVLEQHVLAGGTTWHAAGMVGQLRASGSLTRINKYSVELYRALAEETGQSTGWTETGSLIVAQSDARMTQLRRTAAMARRFDIEAHVLSPGEAGEKWPLMHTGDLRGGVWLPHDGKVDPEAVTRALAAGARRHGATFYEDTRVTGLAVEDGAIVAVETNRGRIETEYVVLCAGMWSRALAQKAGVTMPLYPVEHHYVVSEPVPGARDDLPCGRDPDAQIYFRGEGDRIMLGAFQNRSTPWDADPIPDPFSFALLEPDWEKFAEPLAAGKHRIPVLKDVAFPKFVNGPESFTPDNNFILGETPEVRGLFAGAGFNSVGIASAGGAGKYLAEWIIAGQPTMDLWSVDVRRFMPVHNNRRYLRERASEVLGLHYQMAWPNREPETGRNLRQTPIHDRLRAHGACFGVKMGLERPNWFARRPEEATMDYTFDKPRWLAQSGEEHLAARKNVAIFDQSAFSKYRLQGPDALAALQRLCGANVDVAEGRAVYTGMFNVRGGFESDVAVVRQGEDDFYIVSASAQTRRDFHWMQRNMGPGVRATLTDISGALGVLGVMGPRSRDLLAQVSDAALDNASFPPATARTIPVGKATALAIRLSYMGELGWELHLPMDQMACAYDALWEAGRAFGLRDGGHYAINSLRLEKGFRAWGADITPDDTPFEAGLAFAIAWEKPIPFIGHDALVEKWEALPRKQLVTLVLDNPDVMLWGNEPILRNGEIAGHTTSAAFGHTVGAAIALGYVHHDDGVTPEFLNDGEYAILVDGEVHAARRQVRPPYDPDRRRIRM